ncbi:MAG TPA: hypothetical protein VFV97_08220 [Rhodanobacteraceae bacterium]|nr:hypothetical protein [Rhodanobacteraceae bacterium]
MATRKRMRSTKRTAKTRASKRPPARKTAAKKVPAKRVAPRTRAKTKTKRVARKAASARRAPRKAPAGKTRVAANRRATREASAPPRIETARRLAEPASVDASLFPCGNDALRAATGKDWSEWLAMLDAAGAASKGLDHNRLIDLAMQSLPDSAGWWAQMVSVGYERARGLREKHESCNGEFQATLSKTFPVPLFAAFAAWADASLRGAWLDAPDLSFTKLNAGRNIRARWPDGALLDIRFNATGPDRCQIVVDTMKLDDAEAVQQAKVFWQAQFERLQQYFKV